MAEVLPDAARLPPMPLTRFVGVYVSEAKYEVIRLLRMLYFSIPRLVAPLALYWIFGVLSADPKGNPLAADAKFIGWATYAVVGPGLFVGQLLVVERELGLLALKRALPMPFGAYLTAKVLLALVFAVVVMAVLAPLGLLFGQVAFTPGGWAAVIGILLLGVAPACAISLFIGAWAPPQSAPTLTNGVYVLMVFFGCAIFPTPPAMQALKPLWPTYHLVQLATAAAGLPSHGALWVHVAALTGLTVVLWLLAVHRMRRAR